MQEIKMQVEQTFTSHLKHKLRNQKNIERSLAEAQN